MWSHSYLKVKNNIKCLWLINFDQMQINLLINTIKLFKTLLLYSNNYNLKFMFRKIRHWAQQSFLQMTGYK